MVTVGVIAKIRRIDLLQVILYLAVFGCFIAIGYAIGIRDFKNYFPVIGTLVSIIAVILIYREMNLKNRPYLYIQENKIEIGKESFDLKFTLRNCGTLPAKNVSTTVTYYFNGIEQKPQHLEQKPQPSEYSADIFPDQLFKQRDNDVEYSAGDTVGYTVKINYESPNKKKHYYKGVYEVDFAADGIWIVKTESN